MSRQSIKMTCSCGASFEGDLHTFINGGGVPDSRGRVFIMEVRADEWSERHAKCLSVCHHSLGPKYDTEVGPAQNCTKCGKLEYVRG